MFDNFKRTRFDWMGLNPDFAEPEIVTPSDYKMPSRLRGELFNQPSRTAYVFGDDWSPIPVSLNVFHDQRLIVVEIEVATAYSINAEWPSLEKDKLDFANRILPNLRSRYVGLRSKWMQLICRKQCDYHVQGPFIPREQGTAVVSLVIRVGLDSNFDEAYKIAQRFLELHPENENVEHFKKIWNLSKPERQRPPSGYQWSYEELRAIESMAPLEPTSNEFGSGRTPEERLRFNEIVWRQCQQKLSDAASDYDDNEETEAVRAADKVLRNVFKEY